MNFKPAFLLALFLHSTVLFFIAANIRFNVDKKNYLPVYLVNKPFMIEKNLGRQRENYSHSENNSLNNGQKNGYDDSRNISQAANSESAGNNQQTIDPLRLLLHSKIQTALIYPESARLLQQHGTVIIKFLLHKNGVITDVSLEKSSGYELLDETAIKTVNQVSPLQITVEQDKYFIIPVDFYL